MTVFRFFLCGRQRLYRSHFDLLELVREYGSIRARSVAGALGRSARSIRHSIRGLVELGIVERTGKRNNPFAQYVLPGVRTRGTRREARRLLEKLVELGKKCVGWIKLPSWVVEWVNRVRLALSEEDPRRYRGLVCRVDDSGSKPFQREEGGTKRDGCAEPSLIPMDSLPIVTAYDLWKQRQQEIYRQRYGVGYEPEVWIRGKRASLRDLTPKVWGDICKIGSFSYDDLSPRNRVNSRRFKRRWYGWV